MSTAEQVFGYSALERIADAPRFNCWMYKTVSPFLHGKILEIGSGIGNLSSYFIQEHKDITLSDYDERYIQLLKKKFPNQNSIHLDLSDHLFKEKHHQLENSYDAVFLLNVLEHIQDDLRAINYCRYLLKPGGSLLVLVPSYSFLYSKMDKMLGHYRRYLPASLNEVITKNELTVEKTFHFNALGIAGWWWNKFFGMAEISEAKMKFYNAMVPFAQLLDTIVLNKIGLSIITVAKKTCS